MGEHLFISYATEDAALADWLTLKLTASGYKVWCDRFQLLGGERFPRDIDYAIKNDTFRLLALISKASLEKENPTKERTLALSIGRERKIDFLIPLKTESLSAAELNWMISDITYISFDQGWAPGLAQLLKKLDKISAPKSLTDGLHVAANAVLQEDFTSAKSEKLHTNVIKVVHTPSVIHRFEVRRRLSPADEDLINETWPAYKLDDSTCLSFYSPPPDMQSRLKIIKHGGAVWRDSDEIDGVYTLNIVSYLLRRSIEVKCCQKGLKLQKDRGLLYFPNSLLQSNRIKFVTYNGKATHLLAVGQRTKSGSKYRYHLAPVFEVRRSLFDQFNILMRVRLMITDSKGDLLAPRSALSRRKHLCKNWWNDQWLKRNEAIIYYLADGQDSLRFGNENEEIIFSSKLTNYQVEFGINETLLSEKRSDEELTFIEEADEEEEKRDETEAGGEGLLDE